MFLLIFLHQHVYTSFSEIEFFSFLIFIYLKFLSYVKLKKKIFKKTKMTVIEILRLKENKHNSCTHLRQKDDDNCKQNKLIN